MTIPDTSSLYRSPEGHAAMMALYDAELARLPFAYESRYVPTRCGPTHVLACGSLDAPPLVLVQGYGGNVAWWRPQLLDFVHSFRVYAVDVIGQPGRSSPARPSELGHAYTHWLAEVLDGLGIARAALIGMSYGGRLAIRFGVRYPWRVCKAALISPIGLCTLRLRALMRVAPTAFRLRQASDDEIRRRLLRRVISPAVQALDEDFARRVEGFCLFARHFRPHVWKSLPAVFRLPNRVLRRFTPPTLLLMGEHEVLCDPQAAVRRARRWLPRLVEAEVVAGAGHLMHYERREYVNARVMRFLCEEPSAAQATG